MVTPKGTHYAVVLPVFEGPLDLLLSLIEREQLDITTIALAQVTDQYMAYLAGLEQRRVSDLADFLVLAAKLLLIKSQALLPRPPEMQVSETEDVGQELVAQLQIYQRYREVARLLSAREAQALRSFVRVVSGAASVPADARALTIDLGSATATDLLRAVQEALQAVPAPPVGAVVKPVLVTVAQQIERISRYLGRSRQVSFRRLLSRAASRVEIIVTLQALLEMIKQGAAVVSQATLFGEILIQRPAPDAAADVAPAMPIAA
jgi:segregation and condensation protein A